MRSEIRPKLMKARDRSFNEKDIDELKWWNSRREICARRRRM
jgi:hypothetical protein